MVELVRLILDCVRPLWPFRTVWDWQHGVYFLCGRCVGVVGPGVKLVPPFLCDVKLVPIVPEIYSTPLQTITLRDKTTLTYSASVTVVVRDAARAYTRLGHYAESVVELAARVLSDELADEDPDKFDPARGKRRNMLDRLRDAVNRECGGFGLEVTQLGFTNFVRGVRTFRLLTDKAVITAEPVALV